MSVPTPFERDLGKAIRIVFGSDTKVVRYGDDEGINECFIVSGRNCPVDGVTSYGSVGLSRCYQRAGNADVKVEVVAACASVTPHIDKMVASCVFDSVKNGTNIVYGAYILNIADQYGISKTLKHVTFVSPFIWYGLNKVLVNEEAVHCLLMVPISDPEKDFLVNKGIDMLENIFKEKKIDIFNINRPSAIN